MNKKKISIIAIVLFLCLGTAVFANPSESALEEKTVNNISNNSDQNDNNTKNNLGNANINSYDEENISDAMLELNEISNLVTNNNSNNTYTNATNTQKPNSNGNSGTINNNNPSTSDSENKDSSENNGENSDNNNNNNNNESNDPNNPNIPEKPPENNPTDYTKIRNLVLNLQQLILNAQNRNDIILGKKYRDDNKIIQEVSNIADLNTKTELETILNDINIILEDNQKPIIDGIINGTYTKENVTLSITEINLKSITINNTETSLQQVMTLDQEGIYNITVTDKAYNQENISFVIDKTAPEFIIETSNNDKPTNKNVIVSIKTTEMIKEVNGWTLSKDKKSITKTFENNIADSIIIEDLAGNTKKVPYQVINIDKEFGDVIVTTSNNGQMTNQDVTVTITASEKLQPVNGWILSEDKKSLYKVFEKNIDSYVIIKDLAGNTKKVPYQVINIDKEIPTVIKDGITYEIDKNDNVIVTIKTSKPILTPEGWTIKENPFVFSKIYEHDTTEVVILRDIYANQGIVTITVNKKEIIKNQNKKQNSIAQNILSSVFSNLPYIN